MKPSLIPLQQWQCDVCGELIQRPEHGYLEWLNYSDGRRYGFRIVHHAPHSPRRANGKDCYYTRAERGGDLDLPRFTGPVGLVKLLSWLDAGQEFDAAYRGAGVADLREWVLLVKRLYLPYYEEARQYLPLAKESVEFGHINEAFFYSPDTLRSIIEAYTGEEA